MTQQPDADQGWQRVSTLAGKTVLTTGCGSGIGRETALQLARAGARVISGDRDERNGAATIEAIRAAGGEASFIALDLAQPESVDAFVKQAVAATQGEIDVFVNVAGWDRVEPFLKNTPDLWSKLMSINFLGPVRLIHALLPTMVERGKGGKIITIASDAGRVGSSGEAVYSGTKGAVIAFTKALAREMARYQITANCICPGPTDTPLFAQIENEKLRDALVRANPLRRLAQPIEIAHSIVYFATPAADFITGQTLSVSGGLTMS